jgi:hypothetical protein
MCFGCDGFPEERAFFVVQGETIVGNIVSMVVFGTVFHNGMMMCEVVLILMIQLSTLLFDGGYRLLFLPLF